jgi:hypothetical protein
MEIKIKDVSLVPKSLNGFKSYSLATAKLRKINKIRPFICCVLGLNETNNVNWWNYLYFASRNIKKATKITRKHLQENMQLKCFKVMAWQ